MSESIGLTPEEIEQIQNELKENLATQVQGLIQSMQDSPVEEGFDLVSMMAGKDSIALDSSLEFTQKAISANNKKIADLMAARDTLVLKTAIEFTQRAVEANNLKIFEYIEKKLKNI